MNYLYEYALLIAVASPVAVILAIQVWLFVTGERGTLLLPSSRPFPSVDTSQVVEETAVVEAAVPAPAQATRKELEREAA